MAKKWGNADYKQLQALQGRLQRLEKMDLDKFCEDCSKELAARLLALVIPRTPVGQYPKDTGKKGGTLRRGWTASKNNAGTTYAQSLPITKSGSKYTIEIINPVEYASYVEFGHRTKNGGWVNGRYFLTFSEKELEQLAPGVLEKKLNTLLKEVFDG
ncbi:MAG: HK97 gp10 family phage protein [Oscillospiraceae bacterium]|nr:HK97 gp10 family phage protein [Oscillospiraceae bacterium]